METTISEVPAVAAGTLDLGMVLGQNHAFGIIAGRCSAAQAATIRRLREEKLYKQCTQSWKDFCPQYLKMSGTQADRIIQLWEEFGPGYFELSQLTRISAETYRAIEPAVKEGALHFQGEAIELDPENAERVAQAVNEMRRNLPKEPRELPIQERLERLDKHCNAVIAEFQKIAGARWPEADWRRFTVTLGAASAALQRIEIDHGLL